MAIWKPLKTKRVEKNTQNRLNECFHCLIGDWDWMTESIILGIVTLGLIKWK